MIIRSEQNNNKLDRIRVGRIRTFPYLLIPFTTPYIQTVAYLYDPVKTRLSELEAEAEEPTNHMTWKRTLWRVYSSASDYNNLVFTGL